MRLLVAADSSMYKTPDGKYWCPTIYEYSFFDRYLQVFDEVVVASRVKLASYDDVKGFLRCDGPHMIVAELPDMHGMTAYIKKLFSFRKASKAAIDGVDCAIIRLPSMPATMVLHYYKKTKKNYALEVVADPESAYASNTIAKFMFTHMLKKQCLEANGVSYVTRDYLQRKYPSFFRKNGDDDKHFESYYSTIRLKDVFFGEPKHYLNKKSFIIVHTANNMNNNVKGHFELIQATAKVVDQGYDVYVRFVGDGSLRSYLESKSVQLGIRNRITFVGRLAGSDSVREELINADLLVFPTKAEGLPRSVIEAMAVGLPCISTPVAGIPELLDADDLFDPMNIDGFANRIIEFISNPKLMEEKSIRNIIKAREYSEDILVKRRNEYYKRLKILTEE